MQQRTIALKVTGGDTIELHITSEDAQRVSCAARFNRGDVEIRREVGEARRDASPGLADQLSEITVMLDRISAALGVRRDLKRRCRPRR